MADDTRRVETLEEQMLDLRARLTAAEDTIRLWRLRGLSTLDTQALFEESGVNGVSPQAKRADGT